MENFDKEEFLQSINSFPMWVKDGDDLMRYCKHLKYRLLQSMAKNSLYSERLTLYREITDEEFMETSEFLDAYNKAYSNDKTVVVPFKELF